MSASKEPQSQSQSQPMSQQQYSTLNDSSDDEIPVPMKLSALTKALLNDGHGSAAAPSAPGQVAAHRAQSPPARPASRVTRRSAMAASTSSASDEREKDAGRGSIRQRETRRQISHVFGQLHLNPPKFLPLLANTLQHNQEHNHQVRVFGSEFPWAVTQGHLPTITTRQNLRQLRETNPSHLHPLGTILRPTFSQQRQVWAAIRDAVIDRTLDDEFSLQLCKVSMDICRKYLGPLHAKTMELTVAGVCNFDVGDSEEVIQRQEDMFREMLDGLNKAHGGARFDERHAGVRMNLATFYNFRNMWDKAEALGLETVGNRFIFEESKRYRGMVFKYFYDLGKARFMHQIGRASCRERV